MTDCSNVTMREMLPDMLHDRLSADARGQVEAHLAACADCRAELELLRAVRAGARAPRVDIAGITARIAPYRRQSFVASASRSWAFRAAAAVVLVVGTATLLEIGGAGSDVDTVFASAAEPELSLGGLSDMTDSDLRALAQEMGKLKAVTPAEPEVVVPGVERSGE
jgi:anti-sigma factor RsiW